ncbi:MAG: peptidylprolyl isomerase [Phenylobacterium sp.]|uniref:peptidylprolyl isomerase n=1 Tax=Phenylobacterium sp. TaxID=1871053 RepID=UPI003BB62A8C
MILQRRTFLAGAGALAASPALAAPGLVHVKLTTPVGAIVLALNPAKAPITVANFLRYTDSKRYDGATFYRASRPKGYTADDYGSIQGGLQNDPAKVMKPIGHEPTTKTGLSHTDGAISMGRFAPGSATSDFFICVGDNTYLDANPKAKGDNLGFAAFGYVVEGMDVVRKILVRPRDPNAGVGVMKGEMLKPPVRILSARRTTAPVPKVETPPVEAAPAVTPAPVAPVTPSPAAAPQG